MTTDILYNSCEDLTSEVEVARRRRRRRPSFKTTVLVFCGFLLLVTFSILGFFSLEFVIIEKSAIIKEMNDTINKNKIEKINLEKMLKTAGCFSNSCYRSIAIQSFISANASCETHQMSVDACGILGLRLAEPRTQSQVDDVTHFVLNEAKTMNALGAVFLVGGTCQGEDGVCTWRSDASDCVWGSDARTTAPEITEGPVHYGGGAMTSIDSNLSPNWSGSESDSRCSVWVGFRWQRKSLSLTRFDLEKLEMGSMLFSLCTKDVEF